MVSPDFDALTPPEATEIRPATSVPSMVKKRRLGPGMGLS